MKRRNFLLLTTTGAIATLTPFCQSRRDDPSLALPLFLSTICNAATLRQIGTDYRAAAPGEVKRSGLRDLLTDDLPGDASLPNQLNSKVRQDFAALRTVTVDGWVLSLTEVRQCAMFSLQ
jgi:hypothetical protein